MARSEREKTYAMLGAIALGALISGGSIVVGIMDEGQINVSNVISVMNEERRKTEGDDYVPIKNVQSSKLNDGLVGLGKHTEETPPPKSKVESASSTEEETATTSDGATEDGVENAPES